jgi:hypothetical protein
MPTDHRLSELTALRNVGPAIARRLLELGISTPDQLRGRDPHELFARLCDQAGRPEDPCLLYTLQAVIVELDGGPSRPWWEYAPGGDAASGDSPA